MHEGTKGFRPLLLGLSKNVATPVSDYTMFLEYLTRTRRYF